MPIVSPIRDPFITRIEGNTETQINWVGLSMMRGAQMTNPTTEQLPWGWQTGGNIFLIAYDTVRDQFYILYPAMVFGTSSVPASRGTATTSPGVQQKTPMPTKTATTNTTGPTATPKS